MAYKVATALKENNYMSPKPEKKGPQICTCIQYCNTTALKLELLTHSRVSQMLFSLVNMWNACCIACQNNPTDIRIPITWIKAKQHILTLVLESKPFTYRIKLVAPQFTVARLVVLPLITTWYWTPLTFPSYAHFSSDSTAGIRMRPFGGVKRVGAVATWPFI